MLPLGTILLTAALLKLKAFHPIPLACLGPPMLLDGAAKITIVGSLGLIALHRRRMRVLTHFSELYEVQFACSLSHNNKGGLTIAIRE